MGLFSEHFDRRRSRASKSSAWSAVFILAVLVASFFTWTTYVAFARFPRVTMGLIWYSVVFLLGLGAYKILRYKREVEARDRQLFRLEDTLLQGRGVSSRGGGEPANEREDYEHMIDAHNRLRESRPYSSEGGYQMTTESGAETYQWTGPLSDQYFDANGRLKEEELTDADRQRYMRRR